MLAIEHEGHDVAKWLNSIGVAGFVLTYRLVRPRAQSTKSRIMLWRMPGVLSGLSAAVRANGALTPHASE